MIESLVSYINLVDTHFLNEYSYPNEAETIVLDEIHL